MSLDIDLLFRQAAREPDVIDRVRARLIGGMEFERSQTHTFRYENKVEDSIHFFTRTNVVNQRWPHGGPATD